MYQRWIPGGGGLNPAFAKGVQEFLDAAFSHAEDVRGFTILCPCNKCSNRYFNTRDTTLEHLYRHGFAPCYYVWLYHGERSSPLISGYDYGSSLDKLADPSKGRRRKRNYGLGSQSRGALIPLPGDSGHASSQGSTSYHSERGLRDKKGERQVEEQDAERERQAEEVEAARVAAKESRAELCKTETKQLMDAAENTWQEKLAQQIKLAMREALAKLERDWQVEDQEAEKKRRAKEQEAARVAAKERRWKAETELLIEAAVIAKREQLVQQFALTIEEELVQLKIMQRVISEEVKRVEQRQRAKREREDKEQEKPSISRRVEVEQDPRVKKRRKNMEPDELAVRRMVEEVRREMGEPVNADDDVDPLQALPT